MTKKSKKQPYRNALLKLKKERSSLDGLYKENQRLNANLLYRQEEAHTLLKSAAEDKEQARKFFNSAEQELRTVNPYHPDLGLADVRITSESFTVEDALRYRISTPTMDWSDKHQAGTIRLVCHKQNGSYETVAYGFSAAYIEDYSRYINEGVIEDMGKAIARELVGLANKKMKGW